MANIDLDLDALRTKIINFKYNGQVIEAEAPSVESLFDLYKIYSNLTSNGSNEIDPQKLDFNSMEKILVSAKKLIVDHIPDFKDINLNLNQIISILQVLIEAATPEDTKELEGRGIKLDPDQKKTHLASEKK